MQNDDKCEYRWNSTCNFSFKQPSDSKYHGKLQVQVVWCEQALNRNVERAKIQPLSFLLLIILCRYIWRRYVRFYFYHDDNIILWICEFLFGRHIPEMQWRAKYLLLLMWSCFHHDPLIISGLSVVAPIKLHFFLKKPKK